jgi:hypothetical protein
LIRMTFSSLYFHNNWWQSTKTSPP